MVAAQNMVQTPLGTDNSTKGKKDNNTSRKADTTAGKSVHYWVFELRNWDKTVQFECFFAARFSR